MFLDGVILMAVLWGIREEVAWLYRLANKYT